MFTPITRILFCLVLCLMLASCCCVDPECIKTQDLAIVQTSSAFLDGRFADSLVVRNNNKVKKCLYIGSKDHKATFPVHVEVQLFLRGALRQNLEFEMPKNSILSFYNGASCEAVSDSIVTSSAYKTHEGEFYRGVKQAVDDGMFIDSSRSEIACWFMRQLEDDDGNTGGFRCTKYKGGGEIDRDKCL